MYFVFVWILRFSFSPQTTGYRLIFRDGSFLGFFICSVENTERRCIINTTLYSERILLHVLKLMENWTASFKLWEQPSCILLMVELKQATICIFCKPFFYKIVFMRMFLLPQCVSSLVLRSLCVHPHPPFIATCKQRRVYQFPVVILGLSAPSLHMIIDSIKRGPSIASRHLDLHLYSRCDSVLLMQWNLSLAQGWVEGRERVLIRPPSFISISLSSLSTFYELAL